MKIILVTGDGPEHHFVTNTLVERFDVSQIFVCDPPARRSWKTVLKRDPAQFLSKAFRNLYLKAIGDAEARERALHGVFGPLGKGFSRPDLVTRVGRPKAGKLLEGVKKAAPDILAIYGTGMIPDVVLEEARVKALNMHTGISPHYRGVACATWPIIEREPHMVGATVHECTSRVDGGEIYFRKQAALVGDETLHEVFARSVETGASGYADVIAKALEGSLTGEMQDHSQGREYRGSMLGLGFELRARRALAQLKRSGALKTTGTEFGEG